MSAFNINVAGGSSVRLPTAGKYCDRDIVVTATGGSSDSSEPLLDVLMVNGNGVYAVPDGYSGARKIIVNSDTAQDTTTIYWDGNTEGLERYGDYNVKIADFIPDLTKYSKDVVIRVCMDGLDLDYDATISDYSDHWWAEAGDFAGFYIYPSDHDSRGGIFVNFDPSGSYYIKSITFTKLADSGGDSGGGNGTYSYDFVYDELYVESPDGFYGVKVSDEIPDMSVYANGATVGARNEMSSGETETDASCYACEREVGYAIYSEYWGNDMVLVIPDDSYEAYGMPAGVYFRYDAYYVTTISVTPN